MPFYTNLMSDDLPNQNNNHPSAFGSGFNPQANPQDQNNPYQTPPHSNPVPPLPQTSTSNIPNPPLSSEAPAQEGHPSVHEEVAQNRPRDAQGHFLPYERPTSQALDPNQTAPTPVLQPSGPKPNTLSERLKSIWHFISKNFRKISAIIAFAYLVVMNTSFQNFVAQFFPYSSPILSRAVSYQGLLKTSETGIYTLVLPDQSSYILHFKPTAALTNLKKLNEVVVKGNLTWTPFVIENAELYPLNITLPDETSNSTSNIANPKPCINLATPSAQNNP